MPLHYRTPRRCASKYRRKVKKKQPNKPDKSVEELCKQMNQFELTPSRLMLLGDIPYDTPTPSLATTPANAQRDWDISYHNNNQSPSSPSICEEQPASATTLIPTPTHAPYKKWNIMKLRQKLNYLGRNDQGKRDELIERLNEYYNQLNINIRQSENFIKRFGFCQFSSFLVNFGCFLDKNGQKRPKPKQSFL